MNIFKELKWKLEYKIGDIQSYFYNRKCKKLYPDYEDNEYNCGSSKFIWGVKSWDDLSGADCNIYTMNDIDVTYNRESKLYMLGIETAYMFKEPRKENECKYLKRLLEAFTKFMDDNNYSKEYDYCLFMSSSVIDDEAESIEELYINFKIFVEGYCKVYNF
jgi:hypothetical protein